MYDTGKPCHTLLRKCLSSRDRMTSTDHQKHCVHLDQTFLNCTDRDVFWQF